MSQKISCDVNQNTPTDAYYGEDDTDTELDLSFLDGEEQ